MLVFRDGRRSGAAEALLTAVAAAVRRFLAAPAVDGAALEALLLAGQAEAAVADSAVGRGADGMGPRNVLVRLTDSLAETELWSGRRRGAVAPTVETAAVPAALVRVAQALAQLEAVMTRLPPGTPLAWSVPEGFAFYDVHPTDFAEAAATAALRSKPDRPWLTIGVRTIGATLSAVVAARLRAHGQQSARLTVRPVGHPFARTLSLTSAERDAVARATRAGAGILVVDEGPGLSGSSILATTDAVEAAGCPIDRILVVCTYRPDPAKLRAPDGARRWGRLHVTPASSAAGRSRHVDGARELAPGEWRELAFASRDAWPASWLAFERRKLLTADGRLLKFAGLGPWGRAVRKRAHQMAEAGYGPAVATAEIDGYVERRWSPGRVHDRGSTTPELLLRMTDYLAWRSRALAVGREAGGSSDALREMVTVNLAEAGFAPAAMPPLEIVRPVVPDARLMPHGWLSDGRGGLVKLDGTDHGDDHFHPGPTDVAWDVAGLLVEWGLEGASAELAVDRYERSSGDRVRGRLAAYRLAYLAFRIGYCRLAAEALAGTEESPRFRQAEALYRGQVARGLARPLRPVNDGPGPASGGGSCAASPDSKRIRVDDPAGVIPTDSKGIT